MKMGRSVGRLFRFLRHTARDIELLAQCGEQQAAKSRLGESGTLKH